MTEQPNQPFYRLCIQGDPAAQGERGRSTLFPSVVCAQPWGTADWERAAVQLGTPRAQRHGQGCSSPLAISLCPLAVSARSTYLCVSLAQVLGPLSMWPWRAYGRLTAMSPPSPYLDPSRGSGQWRELFNQARPSLGVWRSVAEWQLHRVDSCSSHCPALQSACVLPHGLN